MNNNDERMISAQIIAFVASYLEANIDGLLEMWTEISQDDDEMLPIEMAEESIINLIFSLRMPLELGIDDTELEEEKQELFYPFPKPRNLKIH